MEEHLVRRPRFRAATVEDVPELVKLVESAYRGESSRAGWTTEADLLEGQRTDPDGVREAVAHPHGQMLIAEREGELVACCQLERRTARPPTGAESAGAGALSPYVSAYFGMFAVRPTAQATGLGRQVLTEAERLAREEWGASEMRMTVLTARADLIAWYERRGYRRTGELLPFPYGDERFGIPLRPDLCFEALVKQLA